jgi:hypothetical protein
MSKLGCSAAPRLWGLRLFRRPKAKAADPKGGGPRYPFAVITCPLPRPTLPALSPLGERVARADAFFSRRGTGEGVRMSADGHELNRLTK